MLFKFYNANPEGKRVKDCAVRAISLACNMSWEDAMMDLARMSLVTHDIINARSNTSEYLKSKGWTKHNGKSRKIKDFKFKGTHLISCHYNKSCHMTFVKDGVLMDTFNCSHFKVDYYFNPPKL